MKIEYDPEADALYIHIVGIEILDASKRLSRSDLSSIVIEKLPLETNPA